MHDNKAGAFKSETQHLTRLLYHPILGTYAIHIQVSLMSKCCVSCSVGIMDQAAHSKQIH